MEILGRDSLHEDPVRERVDARHDRSHAVVGERDDRRAHLRVRVRVRVRGRGRGRGRIRVRVRVRFRVRTPPQRSRRARRCSAAAA